MSEADDWLVHDHRKYEQALAECEEAAGAGDWDDAVARFKDLIEDLKLHMRMEDEVVYPILEQRGDPQGVIKELSEEHDDLTRLVNDLGRIIKARDFDHFLDSLAPLREIMAEHNEHEEKVFREMADEAVLMRREEILKRLDAMQKEAGRRTWEL